MDSKDDSSTVTSSINYFPNEILLHIFSLLKPNHSDLLSCSRVCSNWYFLTASLISDTSKFTIEECFNEKIVEDGILLNSLRKYKHWRLQDVKISVKDDSFLSVWPAVAANIESLVLSSVTVSDGSIFTLLSACTSLQSLHYAESNAAYVLQNKFSEISSSEKEKLKESMKGVAYFRMQLLNLANDAIFHGLMELFPSLHTLVVPSNNITYSSAIYNRFYPNRLPFSPSESVFTFDHIVVHFLKKMTDSIQHLDFSDTLFNSRAMTLLTEIDTLRLKSLKLAACNQLTDRNLLTFCDERNASRETLEELDLRGCINITNAAIAEICLSFPNLKKLNVNGCKNVNLNELHKMLAELDLEELDAGYTSQSSDCTLLSPIRQTTFRRLCYATVSLSAVQISLLLANNRNLTHLDLTSCVYNVKDPTLMMISALAPQLLCLKISRCALITDSGVCGVQNDEPVGDVSKSIIRFHRKNISCLKHKECRDYYTYVTWSLLKEAVSEAVSALPPHSHSPLLSVQPTAISNMKALRELHLMGLKNITDEALKSAFVFRELVTLNLSCCELITNEGICTMAKNCPSIEELDLEQCSAVTDMTVTSLVYHLMRLRDLNLMGCVRLTSDAMDSLSSCVSLRSLNISSCTKIGLKSIDEFSMSKPHCHLTTHNTVYKDDLEEEEEQRRVGGKAPPPPPPPMKKGLLNRVRANVLRVLRD